MSDKSVLSLIGSEQKVNRQQTSTGQQPIEWRTSDTTSAVDKKENEQSDALL